MPGDSVSERIYQLSYIYYVIKYFHVSFIFHKYMGKIRKGQVLSSYLNRYIKKFSILKSLFPPIFPKVLCNIMIRFRQLQYMYFLQKYMFLKIDRRPTVFTGQKYTYIVIGYENSEIKNA